MAEETWRDVWPREEVLLVDETARCLANQNSAGASSRPNWNGLSNAQQVNLADNIAGIFLARERALETLRRRGLP